MLVFEHDLTMDFLLENDLVTLDVVTIVTYTKYYMDVTKPVCIRIIVTASIWGA